ncbi:MAG TPA: hypothetical protein VLU73_14660 [Methylococcaceae bacterium]|jgi:hypothetical protein|nr:hypothetical protein [Methylococcaceae bacterium]
MNLNTLKIAHEDTGYVIYSTDGIECFEIAGPFDNIEEALERNVSLAREQPESD